MAGTRRTTKPIAISFLGIRVLLAGVAMIVLSGLALLVIPAGRAVLGIELTWHKQTMEQDPAQCHIINALAELPVVKRRGARVSRDTPPCVRPRADRGS